MAVRLTITFCIYIHILYTDRSCIFNYTVCNECETLQQTILRLYKQNQKKSVLASDGRKEGKGCCAR